MRIEFDDFQNWLNSFGDLDLVGEARECGRCPIAKFVIAKGFHNVEVYEDTCLAVDQDGEAHSHYMEAWAQSFVDWIDIRYDKGEAVPAFKAREYLRYAQRQTQERREYF